MLRRREVIGWFTLALVIAWPLSLAGADTKLQESKTPIAHLEVQTTRIDWLPKVDYERLILTVAGPYEIYIHRELEASQPPSLSLFQANGERLPDGTYTYELRATQLQEKEARDQAGQMLERPLIQTGFLAVRNGSFVEALAESRIPGDLQSLPKPQLRNVTTKDHQSLVVHGTTCLGSRCTAAGSFPLTLQDDAPILFFDAGGQLSPNRDWGLKANDLFGGGEYFLLQDLTAGTSPFRVEGGAPDLALYVRSNGNVGLGTSTPATQLHVLGTDAGSRNKILVENAGSTNFRELLEIRNKGGAVFILKDMTVPQRWAQGTLGSSFILNEQAHLGVEYVFTDTGNLTIAGTLTQGSSRDLKTDFASLDPKEILDRVSALPVSLWSYKSENGVRHAGPMAEDFHQAFGLGADDKHIAPGDQAGIALLAVQGLNQILETKTQEIATLQRENADLTERVAALEALLLSLVKAKEPAAPAEPTLGPR